MFGLQASKAKEMDVGPRSKFEVDNVYIMQNNPSPRESSIGPLPTGFLLDLRTRSPRLFQKSLNTEATETQDLAVIVLRRDSRNLAPPYMYRESELHGPHSPRPDIRS